MKLIEIDFNNKTLVIFITAVIWAANFRSTFKNIDSHMDTGSYSALKFDPDLILLKNVLSCFFFLLYFLERNINKSVYVKKSSKKNTLVNSILNLHQTPTTAEKILFYLKVGLLIISIYFIEELYFIMANNHILDRIICPVRNLGILLPLLVLAPILLKKKWSLYKHQYAPLIIIFMCSMSLIFFNVFKIKRFSLIYNLNFLFYLLLFILMGIEVILIKILVDVLYVNICLILGIKGVIGTFTFMILNSYYDKKGFFLLFDKLLSFEYDEMYEEFPLCYKFFYVFSLLILQYLKLVVINIFTENHLLSLLCITDIIFFPLYCIERFLVEGFKVSNFASFNFNTLIGIINTVLMLIFNEILELKFWGLDKNLKKNIDKRQQEDLQSSERHTATEMINIDEDNGYYYGVQNNDDTIDSAVE